jgi:hypothetical protein
MPLRGNSECLPVVLDCRIWQGVINCRSPKINNKRKKIIMKNQSLFGAVVCLAGVFGSAAVPAAAAVFPVLTVTLPHAAVVGGVSLPAGKYSVLDVQDHGTVSVFEFVSDSGHNASVLVDQIAVPGNQPAQKTEVVIINDGDSFQVDKIWLSGVEHGYQLHMSKAR